MVDKGHSEAPGNKAETVNTLPKHKSEADYAVIKALSHQCKQSLKEARCQCETRLASKAEIAPRCRYAYLWGKTRIWDGVGALIVDNTIDSSPRESAIPLQPLLKNIYARETRASPGVNLLKHTRGESYSSPALGD